MEIEEIRYEPVESGVDVFRNGSDVIKNTDKIMIAIPSRNNMVVKMIGNSCSGSCSNVAADIKTIGLESFF